MRRDTYSRTVFYLGDAEFTGRELIASVVIAAVMFAIGILIQNKIYEETSNNALKYEQAIQVSDQETFAHCIDTSVGFAICYGDITTDESVRTDNVGDADGYMSMTRIYEVYTRHVSYYYETDKNGNKVRKEKVYYTWDEKGRYTDHVAEVQFLGQNFSYDELGSKVAENYITTNYKGTTKRYIYYGTPRSATGTVSFDITNNKPYVNEFFANSSIDHAIESVHNRIKLYITFFWLSWLCLTLVCIAGFGYFDNGWLND